MIHFQELRTSPLVHDTWGAIPGATVRAQPLSATGMFTTLCFVKSCIYYQANMASPDWDLMTPSETKPFSRPNGLIEYRPITGTVRDEGPPGPAVLSPRRPSIPRDIVFRARPPY